MAHRFLGCDRDQPFLLPPDLRDWLPQGHLAWLILDVVDQRDLASFYRAHRDDGHGHPPTTPSCCSACSSMATAGACGPPGSSSGAALRTSPSGCWPPTSSPTT